MRLRLFIPSIQPIMRSVRGRMSAGSGENGYDKTYNFLVIANWGRYFIGLKWTLELVFVTIRDIAEKPSDSR